ncbi:MAG: ATP-grasp domain-containing protein [Phycisphaerae bacterium]
MSGSTAAGGSVKPMPRELNILFTCAGRRVALLNCFRRSMRKLDIRGKLLATDITPASSAFQSADEGIIVPRVDDDSYIPALLELIESREIGLIVPTTDRDLMVLADEQQRFADVDCTVMIGSPDAIAMCRDKLRTPEAFERAGLAEVRTVDYAAFVAEPFYPVFCKPAGGSGGQGSAVVRDEQQLNALLAMQGKESVESRYVFQQYFSGREYTIDVYRTRDGRVVSVVPRQRLEVRSGEVQQAVTVRDAELIDSARRLGESFEGIWGVFCCQCRRADGDRPRFFEINPRFGGGAPLSIAAGADLPGYLMREVLGEPVGDEVGEFTENLLMLRYDDALFVPADDPESLPGFDEPIFR